MDLRLITVLLLCVAMYEGYKWGGSTGTGGSCKDTSTSCSVWQSGYNICTRKEYRRYKEQCCATCAKAGGSNAGGSCADTSTSCSGWQSGYNICTRKGYRRYKEQCCATCAKAGGSNAGNNRNNGNNGNNGGSNAGGSCRDKWSNCASQDRNSKICTDLSSGPTRKECCVTCKGKGAKADALDKEYAGRDVANACLKAHNDHRRLHTGTKLVRYNSGLAQGAQVWARRLARQNSGLEHSKGTGLGENLYTQGSSQKLTQTTGILARNAVFSWYSEIKDWNYSSGRSNGGATGHFTQVVWKATTEIGCGVALSSDGKTVFVAARYRPRGNFGGRDEYKKNVGRPN